MKFIGQGELQSNKFPVTELVITGKPIRAKVDTCDLRKILSVSTRWHAHFDRTSQTHYVYARRAKIALHRVITDAPADLTVDHWDHDGLNNRRLNLSAVPQSVNSINRRTKVGAVGLRGVTLRPNGKFRASVMVNRKRIVIGTFADARAASASVEAFRQRGEQ